MRNFFLLFFIFSVLIGCNSFQKQEKDKVPSLQKFEGKPNSQLKRETEDELSQKGSPPINKISKKPENKRTKKIKKLKSKTSSLQSNCNLSGRSQKKINSYIVSLTDNFLNDEDIEELLEMHLDDIKKSWPNKCPSHCSAVNDYSISAKAYPLSVRKKTCNKQEAKELYHISKSFSISGAGKDDKKQVYKKAGDWLFSVFIKPFIPFSKNLPKEVEEHKIEKACPSCSFYLDYVYKYTADNQLNLDVTARCGDRRTLFSKFRSDFYLVNSWKCIRPSANFVPLVLPAQTGIQKLFSELGMTKTGKRE